MPGLPGWLKRDKPAQATAPPPPPPAPLPSAGPLALRPPTVPHHWLTLAVARANGAGQVPLPGARIVVRTFAHGAAKPGDVVARSTVGPDGTAHLFLPQGRYAVSATDGEATRAATVHLERPGRATLLLGAAALRAVLTVEVHDAQGAPLAGAPIEVLLPGTTTPAGTATTDARGVAALALPPGAYDVRAAGTQARVEADADAYIRLTAATAPEPPAPKGAYAQRALEAARAAQPLPLTRVRDEHWN